MMKRFRIFYLSAFVLALVISQVKYIYAVLPTNLLQETPIDYPVIYEEFELINGVKTNSKVNIMLKAKLIERDSTRKII